MKKLVFSILFLIFSSQAFCQIQEFKFDASKSYDNGSRIAYFSVVGVSENLEAYYIQMKMNKSEGINRFYIYKGETLRKCMVDCNQSVDEITIRNLINTIITEYKNEKNKFKENELQFYLNVLEITDFPQFVQTKNSQIDKETYKNNIKKWSELNPEKYQFLQDLLLKTIQ